MAAAALLAVPALATAVAAAGAGDLGRAALRFRAAHPAARVVSARHGGLEHASGFAVPPDGAAGEAAARRFLAREGGAFGLGPADDPEALRVLSAPGAPGVAVFRRRSGGLPVFGGEVAVAWRADGAFFLVNGSPTLAVERAGEHRIAGAAARAAALAGVRGSPVAPPVAEAGWLEFAGRLDPVWRVTWTTMAPPDAFVAWVDGATGRLLSRRERRRTVTCPTATPCIASYLDSPLGPSVDPGTGAPIPPGGWSPEPFDLLGISGPVPAGGRKLDGDRASVHNCRGADQAKIPGACGFQTPSDASGSFLASPDPTDPRDAFAEQSAYFHIDRQSRFFSGLDPAFRGIGFIDGYVNATNAGQPFDNAYFAAIPGGAGYMVFGQGAAIDLAYDAEVVYHELTHAAVNATSAFQEGTDPFGDDEDPAALDEGTADTFAFANPDVLSPCLSPYFGSELGVKCLRNADNLRTCRGNGTADNPGRAGETHADGQIWTGFTWALLSAAIQADAAGSTAHRDEMTKALFRALESAGSHPSFQGYAETVRAQIEATKDQDAADFAACTIAQRDLAGCDGRIVPLFDGDSVSGVIQAPVAVGPAAQQYSIDVPCAATALRISLSDDTGHPLLYLRYGAPIEFATAALDGPQYDWLLSSNQTGATLGGGSEPCPSCEVCGTRTPLGAGRWYLLVAGTPSATYHLSVSLDAPDPASIPKRVPYVFTPGSGPAAGPNSCVWGGGPTPQNLAPPVYAVAAPSCLAPVAPPGPQPAACTAKPPAADSSGCGCGSSGAAAALPPLFLLRRRRRARPGTGA